MDIEDKILIWLNKFDFLSHKKRDNIFNALKCETFFEDFVLNYAKIEEYVDYSQFSTMCADLNYNSIDKYIELLNHRDIKLITINSSLYPESLTQIDNSPQVLYCKGDVKLLSSDYNIAIVGTRHPTIYGKQVTEKFSKELTLNGFNIVSGLADGVDTISHKNCLENGGKTIAVVAGGLNNIYPAFNKKLSEKIVEAGGLIITEKQPDYNAMNYDFPVRNRIIAGLSKGVLITEASLKSGTMHTRDYAIEYGKELFVVPGSIFSSASEGCNLAIKQLPTCLVTCVEDILKVFDKPKNKVKPKQIQLSVDEAMIFNILKDGEQSFDEILLKTNFNVKDLSNLLTLMSFRGIIKKLAGNNYSL